MATSSQYDLFDNSLFVLPESYRHPTETVLNPQAWADTVARKTRQDAAKSRPTTPTLDMV